MYTNFPYPTIGLDKRYGSVWINGMETVWKCVDKRYGNGMEVCG